MPLAEFQNLFGDSAAQFPHLSELFVRILMAALIGAAVAYRVWRIFMPQITPPTPEVAQSQTLMAAVGALMTVVIGDHPARAFGLVGLGSFIRFRSGMTDPRDTVSLLIMIGVGMACGVGLPIMALAAAIFVSMILIVFDLTRNRVARRVRVMISAADPLLVRTRVQEIFPGTRIIELAGNFVELGKDSGRLLVELNLRDGDMDASKIREVLDARGVPGIWRVALILEN